LTYVLLATALSGVLALVSAPLIVIKYVPVTLSFDGIYLALWSGVAACTTAALYRAGRLFSVFAREHH
jgi:hypothetical protein